MAGLEKATITNTVTGDRIQVLFNPEEYSLKRDVNYAQAAVLGGSAPIIQFVNGGLQTLEMELLLDTYEAHQGTGSAPAHSDVRALSSKVTDLMNVDASTHAPPVLLFNWSSLTFTCVLAETTQQFLMFLPDGTPVRARLRVRFDEFRNADLEAKEVKRETANYTKLYLVAQGQTLSGIAAEEYDDATLWRPIAIRNAIDVPSAIAVGDRLVIPALPFRDPDTGEVYG